MTVTQEMLTDGAKIVALTLCERMRTGEPNQRWDAACALLKNPKALCAVFPGKAVAVGEEAAAVIREFRHLRPVSSHS